MKTHPVTGLAFVVLSCLWMTGQSQSQPAPTYSYPQPGYSQAPAYPQQQPYIAPRQVPPAYSQQYQQPRYPQSPPQQRYPQPGYPQQQYSQPSYPQQEYVSPMEFLPTFGRKFGDMFRRLFYGDEALPPGYGHQAPAYQPAPGYSTPQPYGSRSLETAPPAYGTQYSYGHGAAPQQPTPPPRYEIPPTPRSNNTPALPPASRMNPGTNTAPSKSKNPSVPAKKYTPPAITKKNTVTEENPPVKKDPSATEYYPLPGTQPAPTTTKSPTATANSGTFLKGKRTSKEGRVISPYAPYQELDVTGLSSGSLALDPTTQKVFEVP